MVVGNQNIASLNLSYFTCPDTCTPTQRSEGIDGIAIPLCSSLSFRSNSSLLYIWMPIALLLLLLRLFQFSRIQPVLRLWGYSATSWFGMYLISPGSLPVWFHVDKIYIYIFFKKWIFKTAKYWKIKSQWCSMRSSLCSFKPCRPSWSWAWSCNGPTYMATLDARSVEDPICRHWLRTILVHSFSSRYTIFFSLSKFSSSFVVIHMRTFFFLICLFN